MQHVPYPSKRMVIFMYVYRIFWFVGLPFALLYLFWRSLKDPSYRENLQERFGFYQSPIQDCVWIHAVSMGEMRSAGPLVRSFLENNEKVVLTHFTPAGRKEARRLFATEIAQGKVQSIWIPVEFEWVFKKFYRSYKPKFGLVMEIEWWPMMIGSARKCGVPLFISNAQYPSASFKRDTRKNSLRAELPSGFAGIFAKSETQAEKFRQVGATNIAITGELRFDQPIDPKFISAASHFTMLEDRPVITISSVVNGEDRTYIDAIKSVLEASDKRPFFIYVPRAPERFDESYDLLTASGLSVARRSSELDNDLAIINSLDWKNVDVLLGDSMGEMYFYLALCDLAITGGGFAGKGAHNVIEPLALRKPVIVGPEIQTIEYPAIEAIDAGVLTRVKDTQTLISAIEDQLNNLSSNNEIRQKIEDFYQTHAGACSKTMDALPQVLADWKLESG